MVILRGDNPQDRMSAMGHKRTFRSFRPMSALPPKADIRDVITRKYMRPMLFAHFVRDP